MSGVTPAGPSPKFELEGVKPKSKEVKNPQDKKIGNIQKEVLISKLSSSNKEIDKNQSFATAIDVSQRVNKLYHQENSNDHSSSENDEFFDIETSPLTSPISESAFEGPSMLGSSEEVSRPVQEPSTYEERGVEKFEKEKEKEKEPEKEKEKSFERGEQYPPQVIRGPRSESKVSRLVEAYEEKIDQPFQKGSVNRSKISANINQASYISDIEALNAIMKGKVLNTLLIYESGGFRQTTVLSEANVVVLKHEETNKFNVLIHPNVPMANVQTAFQKQSQAFGINPKQVSYHQITSPQLWGQFQAELILRYPYLAQQQAPNELPKSSEQPAATSNVDKKERPAKTTKEKVDKTAEQDAIEKFQKAARKNLSVLPEFNKQKVEEKKRVERDVITWNQRAYDVAKADIAKGIKAKEVDAGAIKKRIPVWSESLPPYPIIVRTNPQLYRGELKAKTLEQLAVLFEQKERASKRSKL